MPPAHPLSTAPVTKRIHVGNLAPSVQPKDLVQRFASFGTVVGGEQGVSGLGKTDTGLPRTFAFFSIETTEAQFARCMSMLNGSMWKAHKLRIGPAKPDWQQRRAEERDEAAKAAEQPAARPKKRKRPSGDVNVGFAAKNFELVTPDNLERHRGWILDPKPAPAPLFPVIIRPSHPVQQPPKPAATAWTRGTAKAKPSKAAREALRSGVPLEKPALHRAKRMRIDPRRWGRQRVLFDLASGGTKADAGSAASMLRVGQWECEGPVEADEQNGEAAVTWVFKTRDGQVRRRETVRLTQRSAPHSDNFTALLERMNRAVAPAAAAAAAVEPAATVDAAAAPSSSSAAPVRGDAAYRSPSPPPYVPAAPRTLMYNEEDAFALMASALDDDERDAVHQMERQAYRELALGALEELGAVDEVEEEPVEQVQETARPLPKVEGFAQDDDEDDDELFETLRLRGGGGVESSDDSDSSSSDSDSDSSSDSDDDDSSNTVKQATSSEEPVPAAKSSLKEKLTTLFKPSGATATAEADGAAGFSLFSGMDLDLDPDAARTPSPEPEPLDLASAAAPHALHPQPHQVDGRRFVPPTARDGGYRGGASQPRFSGPSRPFFAFPSGAFDGAVDVEKMLGEGAAGIVERAAGESRARVEGASKDFYRRETQEQIDAEHQQLRELLRGHARKRHREAVKRTKKGAQKRGQAVKLDVLDDE
ncbi:uncharacterized protein RHOBADRAFT_45486 [Rhodotorula graminis WP1]|uniref:RRM domain-containing protein n=1 Tax=Rhodotorula graminis (strain WP1) TaxID=578459 RepID=A0A0P9ENC6_RHOGW|nr:uncharacterized protein RHOBADRAFT_45486 [Rhodotorula graminis WP1]KPV73524.1 hypothetical protein RHOBADRAFT_45486 [Rhodotorula graminis WP1]